LNLIQSNKKLHETLKSKVEITNSHHKLKPPLTQKSIRIIIDVVLKKENCLDYYVFVNILSNSDIKVINSLYFRKRKPTDIITFTYTEDLITEGELLLGIDEIKKNSVFYKTSFFNEFCRVLIHGCLHLVGYNDITQKQKKLIREKENFYLNEIRKYVS
jgi:probable rRNA maturation factor